MLCLLAGSPGQWGVVVSFEPRWAIFAGVIVVVPVVAMWVMRVPAESPQQREAVAFEPAQPSPLQSPLSDADIIRIADAEQALRHADQALKAAHYAYSEPELPDRKQVWSAVSDGSEVPPLELNPQITHAEVIRLPEADLLEKNPGDRLSIPLLEGRSLAVTVEEARRLPNGDYSWRGYVEGEDDDFPVIFTVGKNSAFATITSWEGSYTMESVGGVGYLYRNIVDRGEDAIATPDDVSAKGEPLHYN